MAGFVYFAEPGADLSALDQLGPLMSGGTSRGPSGAAGNLIARSGSMREKDLAYIPDSQRWRKQPKADYWVGMWLEQRPTPDDLLRPDHLAGIPKVLGGQTWIVPVARSWSQEGGELIPNDHVPTTIDINADGEWVVGSIERRYEKLFKAAERFWNSVVTEARRPGPDRVEISIADRLDICMDVLGTNYRVGPAECALLEILTVRDVRDILYTVIDFDTFLDYANKKKEASAAGT